ncbi:hypothetical protein HTV80_08220 [Streptomyces sp. Vc74B-19]|uniref:hypothetical protein n=1 Tax=Streptomyces sp. Vc74B-19 TaxID=2741324 RepID=UPI001BFC37BB|nr:hypothetical protein [Streptomyces sp. Vc74B-19]MBT3163090.1 hypothetical protein [Streptomyces sp. Vc74B-19]
MTRVRNWQAAIGRAEQARQDATAAQQATARIRHALSRSDAARAADRLAATWTPQEEAPR